MSDKYWCSNYSCRKRESCERFINDDNPIQYIKNINNGCTNYLFPFKSGIMKRPFSPDKSGVCKHYIEKDSENRRREFLSGVK